MAGALVDARRAAHGAGTEATHRRPLVDQDTSQDELFRVHRVIVVCVCARRVEDLADRLSGASRRKREDGARLGHGLAADEVGDEASLSG